MKKILSLALALLMMLPLAIGASAGVVYKENPKKDTDDVVTAEEFSDLIAYWKWLNADDEDYDDLIDYLYGSSTVRNWKDYCEKCDKPAKYYISKGNIYCSCTYCGETYEIYVPSSKPEADRNDCKCCSMCAGNYVTCVCDCWDCKYCSDYESDKDWYWGWNNKIDHKYTNCELDDVDFYYDNGRVYWSCGYCGNTGSFKSADLDNWYDWYNRYYTHTLRVYCSRGGDYSMDGGRNVKHGDTRTITFTPDKGYVLYEVTVDGESYGTSSKITLTVTDDTVVRATFVHESTLKTCTFTTSVVGNGKIVAKKNNKTVDADKFTAKYSDNVTLTFSPASANYVVKNVVIDGVSKGALKSYTLTGGITKDHDIKVTFEWKCPYSDVDEKYMDAVEYVTEAGIMGYYNKYITKTAFAGTEKISVKNLVAALAEMADVNEKLGTVDERIAWAKKNDIIADDANLTVVCDVQTACKIVDAFLEVLEDAGDIDFEDFDADDSAKENAISIDLVTEKVYKNNRQLTRYDLASICNLLVNLEIDD